MGPICILWQLEHRSPPQPRVNVPNKQRVLSVQEKMFRAPLFMRLGIIVMVDKRQNDATTVSWYDEYDEDSSLRERIV